MAQLLFFDSSIFVSASTWHCGWIQRIVVVTGTPCGVTFKAFKSLDNHLRHSMTRRLSYHSSEPVSSSYYSRRTTTLALHKLSTDIFDKLQMHRLILSQSTRKKTMKNNFFRLFNWPIGRQHEKQTHACRVHNESISNASSCHLRAHPVCEEAIWHAIDVNKNRLFVICILIGLFAPDARLGRRLMAHLNVY